MTAKSTKEPWMEPADFGKSIPKGLGINLLVKDVAASVGFCSYVLGAKAVYEDEDFAVMAEPVSGAQWLLHADHTYNKHRMSGLVR